MIFLFFNVRRKLNSLQLNVLYGRLIIFTSNRCIKAIRPYNFRETLKVESVVVSETRKTREQRGGRRERRRAGAWRKKGLRGGTRRQRLASSRGLCGRRPGGGEPAQPGVFLPQEEVPTWSQVSEISWKFWSRDLSGFCVCITQISLTWNVAPDQNFVIVYNSRNYSASLFLGRTMCDLENRLYSKN